MSALVMRLELRRSRALLFWLGLTVVLYGGFMAAYYPQLRGDSKALDAIISSWPKEMLVAFGIEGDLGSQGTYFNVYVLSLVWPIIAAIGGIIVATRAVAADLERGFLELSLAAPISRVRLLGSSIVAQLLVLAALALATILSFALVLPLVGVEVDPGRYALVGLEAFGFGSVIAAATTLLAAVTLSRGVAGGVVAGGLLLMYLMQTVAKLVPDLSAMSHLSLFRYFAPAEVLNDGRIPAGDLGVFVFSAAVCWIAALVVFRRRELLA